MSSEKDSTETLQSSTSSLLIFPLSFHYFASREWRGSSFKDGFTSSEKGCEENFLSSFIQWGTTKIVMNCFNNCYVILSPETLNWLQVGWIMKTPYGDKVKNLWAFKLSVVSTYVSIPSRITIVSLSIKPKASKWSTADYIVLSFLCKRAGFELWSLRHIRNFVYLTIELWRCEASRTIDFLTSSCFVNENNAVHAEDQLIPYMGRGYQVYIIIKALDQTLTIDSLVKDRWGTSSFPSCICFCFNMAAVWPWVAAKCLL